LLAQTFRDELNDAVPDGKKIYRDDAPGLAEHRGEIAKLRSHHAARHAK
jgi:hypothetical protein